MALAIVLFFIPHKIAAWGPPGVAIFINYVTGISLGWGMLIINIPLIIFGYRKLGRLYFVKTIIIVIAISLLTDFLSSIFNGFTISDLRIID
jgi:uncharacterized membrane-anchored protein YitT (DUF2179 family)